MRLMTVPEEFCWTDKSYEELNGMTLPEKQAYLKKDEIKIRQSLGEAVPTAIFYQIANSPTDGPDFKDYIDIVDKEIQVELKL